MEYTHGSWDAGRYDNEGAFVSRHGRDLVDLLDPQKSELILDLGCGTGELAEDILSRGADVMGIDSDPAMIERAQARLGDRVWIDDARTFSVEEPVDAVFSNAVLHWMEEADVVARNVRRALKDDGRFVAEMGGYRNVATVLESLREALAEHGFGVQMPLEGYFPRPSEYAAVLENAGFDVSFMTYFPRPTVLGESGPAAWVELFRSSALDHVPAEKRRDVLASVNRIAAPRLLRDGVWYADYWRLRFVARPAGRP